MERVGTVDTVGWSRGMTFWVSSARKSRFLNIVLQIILTQTVPSQIWAEISDLSRDLRFGLRSQIWADISDLGRDLRFGPRSQIWAESEEAPIICSPSFIPNLRGIAFKFQRRRFYFARLASYQISEDMLSDFTYTHSISVGQLHIEFQGIYLLLCGWGSILNRSLLIELSRNFWTHLLN